MTARPRPWYEEVPTPYPNDLTLVTREYFGHIIVQLTFQETQMRGHRQSDPLGCRAEATALAERFVASLPPKSSWPLTEAHFEQLWGDVFGFPVEPDPLVHIDYAAVLARAALEATEAPTVAPRRSMSPGLRFAILHRDGFTCRYCGRSAPAVELHVDHVLAWVKGGTNHPDNLVAACVECNLGKHTKSVDAPRVPHPPAVVD